MSISYTLYLPSHTSEETISAFLAEQPGYQWVNGSLWTAGLCITVQPPTLTERQCITEAFGFVPEQTIEFQRARVDDPIIMRRQLVSSSAAIVALQADQAALVMNGERPIIHWRHETTLLNPIEGFWDSVTLSALNSSYEFRSMPLL